VTVSFERAMSVRCVSVYCISFAKQSDIIEVGRLFVDKITLSALADLGMDLGGLGIGPMPPGSGGGHDASVSKEIDKPKRGGSDPPSS
jgi:hypothetical protein